jgi:GT2 family glycosyltransferase
VDHVIGCLNLYRKDALLGAAGLFDIRLSPCQMVDVEHHLRARRRGYDVLYHGLIEVEHHKSMGKGLLEDRYLFSNSMGNVVKLTHGVAPDAMAGLLEETALRRSGSAG